MILSIAFAAAIASPNPIEIRLDFMDPDVRLESFSVTQEEVEEEDPGAGWPWRIAGYLTEAACGLGVPVTSHYRTTRSDWTPNGPDNSAMRTLMFGGFGIASNIGSERVRKDGHTNAAWTARLSTLGACVWDSINNARNGWERQ